VTVRDERDLLWKFRHCLTDNRKALTKFLLCVDWSVEQEVAQVMVKSATVKIATDIILL
jgi:Phosphoinositide 3-kinase family, accessory domain (PIK domain)